LSADDDAEGGDGKTPARHRFPVGQSWKLMSAPVVSPSSPRLVSLDALRGFDMFWIIGADALGGAFAHFRGGGRMTVRSAGERSRSWNEFGSHKPPRGPPPPSRSNTRRKHGSRCRPANPPASNVQEVVDLHGEKGIRHLPVVDNGRLVGVLSSRDVLHWVAQQHVLQAG
jgi:hypothetical protein